ncbi:hypothetical protein EYF80_061605 [Liparis tanakae]|uniref:Uncharacterized protein n=1 Tax=Liparis tanakae TaxID=230148 RepID=A0A4Z2EH57_9TELE|nr:hypothetical protein EYF80_061605 [Liparis tanakae]
METLRKHIQMSPLSDGRHDNGVTSPCPSEEISGDAARLLMQRGGRKGEGVRGRERESEGEGVRGRERVSEEGRGSQGKGEGVIGDTLGDVHLRRRSHRRSGRRRCDLNAGAV